MHNSTSDLQFLAPRRRDDRKSARLPMYHGARGKFSEVDTEGFAIHTLREYRQSKLSESLQHAPQDRE